MKKIHYIIAYILVSLIFPLQVFAVGDVTVDTTTLTIEQGQSATFKITADNTAGHLIFNNSDESIANIKTVPDWIENETLTIEINTSKVGTSIITVNINAATFDEEVIKKEHQITVNVVPKKSSNNKLSNIKVNNVTINKFNADTTTYTLNKTTDESINITATAEDSKAKISGTGIKKLVYGLNVIKIVVTAEDGSEKTYTLKITRNDNRSSENSLSSLVVEGYDINFKSDNYTYYLDVPKSVDKLNITAISTDSKAKVVINNLETLEIGENTITIDVTAENGTTQTYKIIVKKESELPPITLDNLLDIIDQTESETIVINIKDNNDKISREILEKIKLLNKKLIINKYQNNKLLYTWELEGKDIITCKEINTLIEFYSSNDSEINKLTDNSKYLYFNNNLDTSIFNNIILKIYTNEEYNDRNIFGYLYNNEILTKKYNNLEYKNTHIEIENLEKGTYIITEKEINDEENSNNNLILISIITLLIITSIIIIIILKRKKKNKKAYK